VRRANRARRGRTTGEAPESQRRQRDRTRRLGVALVTAVLIAAGVAEWVSLHAPQGASRLPAGAHQFATDPTPPPTSSASTAPTPIVPSPIPGYLLIADRGNDRMLVVDSRKRIVWTYPRPGQTPTFPFHFDDDAFFAPDWGSIITNQEDQQTINVVSFPEGRVLWHYGHVNVRGSGAGYLSTPDDAYLLADGTRTVADIRNCRVLFITPGRRVVRQLGTTGVCGHDPPRLLGAPNGDTPLPGGGTLVTEIDGSWIDAFSRTGKLQWSVQAPVRYPSDAQLLRDGRILVADYSSVGRVIIMTRTGRVVWSYGPASGSGALSFPSLALQLPNGLIAVNDDHRHRVVLISESRHRIVWQYGHTDVAGLEPGFLDTPDGMDFLPFDVGSGLFGPGLG
jgi:hypothetical protein